MHFAALFVVLAFLYSYALAFTYRRQYFLLQDLICIADLYSGIALRQYG
jgi:hypothetical protein